MKTKHDSDQNEKNENTHTHAHIYIHKILITIHKQPISESIQPINGINKSAQNPLKIPKIG